MMQEVERKVVPNMRRPAASRSSTSRLQSINLPQTVSESVYDRMRAERASRRFATCARAVPKKRSASAPDADRQAQVTLANAYKQAETAAR